MDRSLTSKPAGRPKFHRALQDRMVGLSCGPGGYFGADFSCDGFVGVLEIAPIAAPAAPAVEILPPLQDHAPRQALGTFLAASSAAKGFRAMLNRKVATLIGALMLSCAMPHLAAAQMLISESEANLPQAQDTAMATRGIT